MSLAEKIEAIATKVYGAGNVTFDSKVKQQLATWDKDYGSYPVCMAKTPKSLSDNPDLLAEGANKTIDYDRHQRVSQIGR